MAVKASKAVTKNDIELEKIRGRNRAKQSVAKGVSCAIPILAAIGPMWFVFKSLEALAGKETSFSTTVGVSLSIAITGLPLLAWNAALKRQLRLQREELIRLRERAAGLEARLKEADNR